MHITIIIGPFLPLPPKGSGAVEKLWLYFAKEAAKRNHKVHLITKRLTNQKKITESGNLKISRITNFNFTKYKFLNNFLDLIYTLIVAIKKIERTELIITNTFWAPAIIPFFKKYPVLASVERLPKGQLKYFPKSTYYRANSNFVKKKIINEGIKKKKIILTPNFLTNIEKNKKKIKKENIILYAGRINKEKGLNIILNCLKYLKKEIYNWKVVFVGPVEIKDGGSGKVFLKEIKKKFKKANIKFEYKKTINNASKLNVIYRKSKIFLYPSISNKGETFGLSIIEAMSNNCIPIVSNLGPFKEIIKHQKNGLIFNYKNFNADKKLADLINLLILKKNIKKYLQEIKYTCRKYDPSTIIDTFLKKIKRIKN